MGFNITHDPEVYKKLDDLEKKINGIIDGSTPASTTLTGSYVEYRILSTDPMPEAKVEEKGAQLLIMDTGQVYFNHGGTWGEFA